MKLVAPLSAVLSLVLFSSIPAAAQDSSGPLGRLMGRFRSTHAEHVHNHAAPAVQPTQYQYVDASGAWVQPEAEAPTGWSGGGDPYGFINVLNRIRASAGLRPVSYDANLSSWARQNNAVQSVRGLGHHVSAAGATAQNCAWNYSNADEAAAGWMNSPGHRENMLSPSITHVGIAFGPGPYWTLNAR